MIRAAAKNSESVVVVVRPERYAEILAMLHAGGPDLGMRRRLAAEAFAHTAAYDSWIAAYLRDGRRGVSARAAICRQPRAAAEIR